MPFKPELQVIGEFSQSEHALKGILTFFLSQKLLKLLNNGNSYKKLCKCYYYIILPQRRNERFISVLKLLLCIIF